MATFSTPNPSHSLDPRRASPPPRQHGILAPTVSAAMALVAATLLGWPPAGPPPASAHGAAVTWTLESTSGGEIPAPNAGD
jgi:hypothetical protein